MVANNYRTPVLVSEASDIRIYFWLKGNILALIYLKVLLLNNYEISSIYEYHVLRKSRAKQLKLGKKGGCPEIPL